MYTKFYGLAESPFRITPDPRFLYLGAAHREALATLIYGIREHKGIVALTGGVGTGKTTLLEGLFERLASECVFVRIRDPRADFPSILRELLAALGMPSTGVDRSEAMRLLWERLSSPEAADVRPTLVIDEAQDVRDDVLEDFRLLSNLETHERKLVQMLLVGQPEFRARIEAPALEPLRQRIALSTTIHPLSLPECSAYVKHRLTVAGAEGDGIFALGAFEAIHDYARGIPRLINVVCDGALSMGYATGARPIHAGLIREVVKDLKGAAPGQSDANRARAAEPAAAAARRPRRLSSGAPWVAAAVLACAVGLGSVAGPLITAWRRPEPRPRLASTAPAPSAPDPAEPAAGSRGSTPTAAPVEHSTGATPLDAPSPQVGVNGTATAPVGPSETASADMPALSRTTLARNEPEPTFDGVPQVEDDGADGTDPDASGNRVPVPPRSSRKDAKDAKDSADRSSRARDKPTKAAKPETGSRAGRPAPVSARGTEGQGVDAPSSTAPNLASNGALRATGDPVARPEPSSPDPVSHGPVGEARMLIVPDATESAAPAALGLRVKELYASHQAGVPEASPRFVPGDSLQLVALYELVNAPASGGDVTIDLWIRGPNQEDMPALGARKVIQAHSGTFQAAAARRLPPGAPPGVYGLVARVTFGDVEARRVFLFRVD